MMNDGQLHRRLDLLRGTIDAAPQLKRHLSDLRGSFADSAAYEQALRAGDPLLYTVTSVELGAAAGDLHYALGMLMPGRVGTEYYLTRGHVHAWREAAEVYIGLRGSGAMLLQGEHGGACSMLPLGPDEVVYVPGHTAHRTINTGDEPLLYLGIYPAGAGHDYAVIAERQFHYVLIAGEEGPQLCERTAFVQALEGPAAP